MTFVPIIEKSHLPLEISRSTTVCITIILRVRKPCVNRIPTCPHSEEINSFVPNAPFL